MEQKKQMIVFDADSVLLDWFLGFVSFLVEKGHCVKHLEPYIGTTTFVPTEKMTKVDCQEYNKNIIKEFADSGYLSQLQMFQDDASAILEALRKEFCFAVVTCIGRTDSLISQRNQNLNKHFGDIFEKVICIDFGESKENSLRELSKEFDIVAFIDDRAKHLEEALNVGITPILMSRGVDVCPVETSQYHVISCLSEVNDILKKCA